MTNNKLDNKEVLDHLSIELRRLEDLERPVNGAFLNPEEVIKNLLNFEKNSFLSLLRLVELFNSFSVIYNEARYGSDLEKWALDCQQLIKNEIHRRTTKEPSAGSEE